MKRIFYLFILAFSPVAVSAQLDTATIVFELDTPTVRYYLDTIRRDSFFLIEQTSFPGGGPRPVVHYTPTFFTDTAAFNLYIDAINEQVKQLGNQLNEIKLQKSIVEYRVARLQYLRDSIFRGVTGVPEVRTVAPPPTEIQSLETQLTIEPQKGVLQDRRKRKKQ